MSHGVLLGIMVLGAHRAADRGGDIADIITQRRNDAQRINTWRIMMARVHIMGGYLNVEGMSGGFPDNELPGSPPIPARGCLVISLGSTTRCRPGRRRLA